MITTIIGFICKLTLKNECVQHFLLTKKVGDKLSQIEHMHVIISHGLFLVILEYLFPHLNIKSCASL